MAGIKGQKGGGGARAGAGRKSTSDEKGLRALMNSAWSMPEREAAVQKHALAAKNGDINSFKALMAYTYGTPPSGDEILIEEGVIQFVNDGYQRLVETYGEKEAKKIIRTFGVDPEAIGETSSA